MFFSLLRRRVVILGLGCGLIAGPLLGAASDNVLAANARAIVSKEGSGRATAYSEQHKIITVENKTHVVWLDADESRFLVRGRTLDRTTGQWSAVVTIGEAQDNHGGPSLAVDGEGYLHVVYYPHHQPVRYRRSVRPNDLSTWSAEIQFGQGLSYPSMICARDGTLVLTARRGYFDAAGVYVESQHMEQELWTKRRNGGWERQSTLLRSRFPRYAQFATTLVWGGDGTSLHLGTRIYETPREPGAKAITTVGYMKSLDNGRTWTSVEGKRIALPATAESIEVLAGGGAADAPQLNIGPLAISSSGVPHVFYTARTGGRSQIYLATPAPGQGWKKREMRAIFPQQLRDWEVDFGMGGGLTFSESGRATLAVVVLNPTDEERGTLKEWGHPGTEVLRVWSDDNFTTSHAELLKPTDEREPHWLVNIERATGPNVIPAQPGILFTAGVAGGGLKDLKLENRVIWQPANPEGEKE
jgi:hypothetical protein